MPQLNALTSLRAFLAWWVVLYHLIGHDFAEIALPAGLESIRLRGYLAVDGFFILSGFIIAYVYRRLGERPNLEEYGRFLALRLARLYPLHFVMLLLFVALYVVAGLAFDYRPRDPERYSAWNFWLNLLLVHGWGFAGELSWNYPSWSVSTEWFAYLAFPAAALLLRRGPALAAISLAVCGALLFVLESSHPNGILNYHVRGALWRIAVEFTMGCALFRLWQAAALRTPWLGLAAACAAVGALFTPHDALAVIALGVLVFALAGSGDWLGRWLDRPLLVYAGEISFAVYMFHAFIQTLAVQVGRRVPGLHDTVPQTVQLAVALALIWIGAALLYRFVECPPRQLVKGWLHSRRAARAGAARPVRVSEGGSA